MNTIPNSTEILLVEDNPRDADMTMRALRKRNLVNQVIHLKDGQEALDWLFSNGAFADRDRNHTPKVILLDLKLPKVDGLEVLRQIKLNGLTKTIPVVVLTSSAEDRDLAESYRLGVNSYIVKPVDFEKFSQAMSDVGCYWLMLNKAPRATVPPSNEAALPPTV